MKKNFCILTLILCFCLLVVSVASSAFAEASENGDANICGENATWELKNNTLYIHGTGAIYDYDVEDTPWHTSESKFRSLVIDEGITRIGAAAFKETKISRIEWPSTLESIGEKALYNTDIRSANLPEGLVAIEDYAFANCRNLKEVSLPGTLTNIGDYAFAYSYTISKLVISEGVPYLSAYCFSDSKLQSIIIPEGVEEIGKYCFDDNKSLMTIQFPLSMRMIDVYAFDDCKKIREVKYAGVEKEAREINILEGNPYLTSATWTYSDGQKAVWEEVSNSCGNNATWEFKNGTLTITGEGAIEDYSEKQPPWITYESKIKTLIIGEGITEIGAKAFEDLEITKVELPSTLKIIKSRAFNSTNIINITLPENLETIESSAFAYCHNLRGIKIPASVTYIGTYAFNYCRNANTVEFDAAVETLESGAFGYVKAREITIPEGVKTIGSECFEGAATSTFNLPSSLEAIGNEAFSDCKNLKTINYAGEISKAREIAIDSGNQFILEAKWNCTDEKGATLEMTSNQCGETATWECKKSTLYIHGTGAIYDYNSNEETPWYTSAKQIKMLEIDEGITEIGVRAFYNMDINTVKLPSTLKRIGEYAFSGTDIRNIDLPEGLETIEDHAFYWCYKIRGLIIPDSVETIGDYAFYYGKSMQKLKLPASLTYLGAYAFYENRASEIEIPEGVASIGEGCFNKSKNLTTVKLPSSLEFIEKNAFEECTKLKTVKYAGTEDDAQDIMISEGNQYLKDASWVYQ